MRVNKKKEYLNGMEHDIEALESELVKGNSFFIMFGDTFSRYSAKKRIEASKAEIKAVLENKNYKPWK